jgi:hypothetical protein
VQVNARVHARDRELAAPDDVKAPQMNRTSKLHLRPWAFFVHLALIWPGLSGLSKNIAAEMKYQANIEYQHNEQARGALLYYLLLRLLPWLGELLILILLTLIFFLLWFGYTH